MFSKITLAALLLVANFGVAHAADEVFSAILKSTAQARTPKEIKSTRGIIKEGDMSGDEVIVSSTTRKGENIETTNIELIKFDKEPREFDTIHDKMAQQDYAGAYADLQAMIEDAKKRKIDLEFANDMIKKEFEYLQVYLPAMMVITGTSKTAPGAAAGPLLKFVTANPKFYRYYQGMETIGHLSVLAGGEKKLDNAKRFYGGMDASALKENKARMNLFYARALLSEKRTDDVAKILAGITQDKSDLRSYASTIQQAKVTQAAALAAGGATDDGIKRLEEIVEETPPTDREAHAWANVSLGNAYNAKGMKVKALLAFS